MELYRSMENKYCSLIVQFGQHGQRKHEIAQKVRLTYDFIFFICYGTELSAA